MRPVKFGEALAIGTRLTFFSDAGVSGGPTKQALISGRSLRVRWSTNREAGVLGLLRSRQRLPIQYQTRQQGVTTARSGGLVRERRKKTSLVGYFPIQPIVVEAIGFGLRHHKGHARNGCKRGAVNDYVVSPLSG